MSESKDKSVWFTESGLPLSVGGVQISVEVNQTLHDEKGEFGHVQVFDTPFYGNMLAIDGIIQVAEKDEFIYHEMMVTLPAIKHGNPKSILIIGGGDGGAAKQALRLEGVEDIVMVEIDNNVIEVCEKYLPSVSEGALRDKRLELIVGDGAEYVRTTDKKFDVVVLDLTDPVPNGPAEQLFGEEFYGEVKNILNEGGYVSMHCGSLVLQPEEGKLLKERLSRVFSNIDVHSAVIPTYQLSLFGFLIASDNERPKDMQEIRNNFSIATVDLKYLSPDVYFASQVLPPYLAKQVGTNFQLNI